MLPVHLWDTMGGTLLLHWQDTYWIVKNINRNNNRIPLKESMDRLHDRLMRCIRKNFG